MGGKLRSVPHRTPEGTTVRQIDPLNSPYQSNLVVGASFTVGVEATNTITVAVQLTGHDGQALTERAAVPWYLSTDADGDNLAASAPSSGTAAGASGLLIEWTADKAGLLVTDATGLATVVLSEASTPTFYLVVVLPDGSLAVSAAITFA